MDVATLERGASISRGDSPILGRYRDSLSPAALALDTTNPFVLQQQQLQARQRRGDRDFSSSSSPASAVVFGRSQDPSPVDDIPEEDRSVYDPYSTSGGYPGPASSYHSSGSSNGTGGPPSPGLGAVGMRRRDTGSSNNSATTVQRQGLGVGIPQNRSNGHLHHHNSQNQMQVGGSQLSSSPRSPSSGYGSPPLSPGRQVHSSHSAPRLPSPPISAPSSSLPNPPLVPPPNPRVRRPTATGPAVTQFAFTPHGYNSMILIPSFDVLISPEEQAELARYHISVSMNCFVPGVSYTTIIRRGGSSDGEYVGEIETGNPEHKDKLGTVRVGQIRMWSSKVLKKGHGSHKALVFGWKNVMTWEFADRCTLLWNCSDSVKKCYRVTYTGNGRETAPLIASLIPPHVVGDENYIKTTTPAILEINPDTVSQSTFDHVVMSALIMERRRLLGIS
ncbi:hypothetical protein JAAARDRAFT_32542 [Jaapia argillacea MUCL 33604]|uniref:DUF6593 domain-containing protein n=1 Tax=Jaapia argillacea MUCL 33604 TaxID=933084 RepID=A0A067Q1W8_9AGAM|nr:hypothetical protein JAAARDRAFT_32542 [Jaapia argillacea MUCL 33604]